MSQNTKQYATIEQAIEMVSEYMKGKGWKHEESTSLFFKHKITDSDYYKLIQYKGKVYFYRWDNDSIIHFNFAFVVPESKEDFLTLMGILDV